MKYLEYETKIYPLLRFWFSISKEFLPLLPSPLKHKVVVAVKVLYTGQIDLFTNYLHPDWVLYLMANHLMYFNDILSNTFV